MAKSSSIKKEFAAVFRAKNAAKSAGAGIQPASKDIKISGGLGFAALNPEEQTWAARSAGNKSVVAYTRLEEEPTILEETC